MNARIIAKETGRIARETGLALKHPVLFLALPLLVSGCTNGSAYKPVQGQKEPIPVSSSQLQALPDSQFALFGEPVGISAGGAQDPVAKTMAFGDLVERYKQSLMNSGTFKEKVMAGVLFLTELGQMLEENRVDGFNATSMRGYSIANDAWRVSLFMYAEEYYGNRNAQADSTMRPFRLLTMYLANYVDIAQRIGDNTGGDVQGAVSGMVRIALGMATEMNAKYPSPQAANPKNDLADRNEFRNFCNDVNTVHGLGLEKDIANFTPR